MSYELFIAKRYIKSKHKLNFITIISVISTLGITLGVAALIVVLSVFNGFGGLVTSILVNFDPHIRITAAAEEGHDKMLSAGSRLKSISSISSIHPFVSGKAFITKGDLYSIVDLKGIDFTSKDKWSIQSSLKYGHLLRTKENSATGEVTETDPDGIILGLNLATKLTSLIGDTVYLTSFNDLSRSAVSFAVPYSKKMVVRGVFESNNNDYDFYSVFTSLQNAQEVLGLGDDIHGYEIRLDDISKSNDVKQQISGVLDKRLFSVDSWYDLHRDLYMMMQIERWAAYVIVSLIIAVASFNLLGSMSMSVIEKKKDIGILRSMGAKDKSIMRIFMFEGLIVGVLGTISGSILGLLIVLAQKYLKFYPLDPTKYIIDALPVELRLGDFFAVAFMSLLLSFLASLYPARRSLKITLLDAIKWE
ncbi:MAG: FtsX-like permease family protein [Bacteroidota bacterium]